MERSKLLGNMNFVTAIAAFFHLSFIMDLKYPKQSETLGDLLQRRVCKYGDESGMCFYFSNDHDPHRILILPLSATVLGQAGAIISMSNPPIPPR